MFLAPGAILPGMPPAFATPAAFGDLAAALLALIGLMALRQRWAIAGALLWLFSIEGILDLTAAITLAMVHNAAPFMWPAYWIPAFWVPTLIVTHITAVLVLWRHGAGVEQRTG
jgi:glycerol-3-phosphate acyltransferase PlsY